MPSSLKPSPVFLRRAAICLIALLVWIFCLLLIVKPLITSHVELLTQIQFQPLGQGFDENEEYAASKLIISSSAATSKNDDSSSHRDPTSNDDDDLSTATTISKTEVRKGLERLLRERANDLCGFIRRNDDADENKNRCEKRCSPHYHLHRHRPQHVGGAGSVTATTITAITDSNDKGVEILPEFPCFPSNCRCPAPDCYLERRTDPLANKIRSMKKRRRQQKQRQNGSKKNSGDTSGTAEISLSNTSSSSLARSLELYSRYVDEIHHEGSINKNGNDDNINNINKLGGAIHDEYLCVKNPFLEKHRPEEFQDEFDELHCGDADEKNDEIPLPFPSQDYDDVMKVSPAELLPVKITSLESLPSSASSSLHHERVSASSNSGYIPSPKVLKHAQKSLHRFKRATTWGFSQWRDWATEETSSVFSSLAEEEYNKQKTPKINQNKKAATAAASHPNNNNKNNNNKKTDIKYKFVTPINSGVATGSHNPKDGIYRAKNICIKPDGSPFGYEPAFDKFSGVTETNRIAPRVKNSAAQWLKAVHSLKEPPHAVLDGKVMLMAADWKSDNPGHAFYRYLAARNQARHVWGKRNSKINNPTTKREEEEEKAPSSSLSSPTMSPSEQRKEASRIKHEIEHNLMMDAYDDDNDFHIIYLTRNETEDPETALRGYNFFYQFLGSSWSTIISGTQPSAESRRKFFSRKFLKAQEKKAREEEDQNSNRKVKQQQTALTPENLHRELLLQTQQQSSSSSSPLPSSSAMVCFKEIVFYHVCYSNCAYLHLIGNSYHVPYQGDLMYTQKLYMRQFREVFAERCLTKKKTPVNGNGIDTNNKRRRNNNNDHDDDDAITTRITILVRKYSRIDLGMAHTIPAVASRFGLLPSHNNNITTKSNNNNKYELRVVSQNDLTPKQFLQLIYSRTDILIGSMGASLSFSWLLPVKYITQTTNTASSSSLVASPPSVSSSVLVEISAIKACAAALEGNQGDPVFFKGQGWNKYGRCDFGAMADAIGADHLAVTLREVSTFKLWIRRLGIPLEQMKSSGGDNEDENGMTIKKKKKPSSSNTPAPALIQQLFHPNRTMRNQELQIQNQINPLKIPGSWIGTEYFLALVNAADDCRRRRKRGEKCKDWNADHSFYKTMKWGVDS